MTISEKLHTSKPTDIGIRLAMPEDWPDIWAVLQPIFRAGSTYAVDPDINSKSAYRLWMDVPETSFVAVDPDGAVVGTYFLKPNQAGPGGHVSNCGYAVAAESSGKGVATAMCLHSLDEARRRGYRAMQFNCVVSTNARAVALWNRLGFRIVGTIPDGFRDPRHGWVDAHIMFKKIDQS